MAGARQQSRRAVVSSLTLSCFDRQRACIPVQSLAGDDWAAARAAHTRDSQGKGAVLAPVSRTLSSLQTVSLEDAVAGSNSSRAWDAAGLTWLTVWVRHAFVMELFSFLKKTVNEKKNRDCFSVHCFLHYLWCLTQAPFSVMGLKMLKKAHYAFFCFVFGLKLWERLRWIVCIKTSRMDFTWLVKMELDLRGFCFFDQGRYGITKILF